MKFKNLINKVLICILVIVIVVLTSEYIGNLYMLITNQKSGGTWIGDTQSWNFIFGLLVSYLFFIPLLASLLFKSKKKYFFVLLIIPVIIFDLTSNLFINLIFDVLISIIGWLIGEGILRIYKLIKK